MKVYVHVHHTLTYPQFWLDNGIPNYRRFGGGSNLAIRLGQPNLKAEWVYCERIRSGQKKIGIKWNFYTEGKVPAN